MCHNHPTILFNQSCGWYKTLMLLARIVNIYYKLNVITVWRPQNLSPQGLVEYYSSFG